MKNAMVWGATGAIGRSVTAGLVAREWRVIAIGRNLDSLETAVEHGFEADVRDAYSVQNAVRSASFEVDQIDLWVYAVGHIESLRVDSMSLDSWQRVIDANLSGAFLTTHHSLPLLAEDAHLFYLGAVSERLRLPSLAAYAAAKAGLEAFADTLRKEQRRLRVTVVRPSAVATPFWDKVPMRLPKDAASPTKVAQRILQAYDERHSGLLDLLRD